MLENPPKLESFILIRARNFYGLSPYKNGWNAEDKRSYCLPGSTKCAGNTYFMRFWGKVKMP